MAGGGAVRGVVARATAAVMVAAVGAGVASPAQSTEQAADDSTRSILVVGDSITHGSSGDYTWRYFAWKQLEEAEADVDFVGPSRKVHVAPGDRWRARYADPDFDTDHAATWGDRISYVPMHDREALVEAYEPDVVVLGLGTNDLLLGFSAATVVDAVSSWVEDTREQWPGTDFVLLEVPGQTTPGSGKFNKRLAKLASRLDTSDERVTVARTSVEFRSGKGHRKGGDTYDPHHPNARGQVKIAAAVVDGLARIGVGEEHPRPLVFVPEGPRVRPKLVARRAKGGARLRWSVPAGADSADVWMRAPKKSWKRVLRAHPRAALRVRGLAQRHRGECRTYAFRVRMRKGWTLAGVDMTSKVRRVRVGTRC